MFDGRFVAVIVFAETTYLIQPCKVLEELSPLSQFSRRFYRACTFTWRELFFAHLREHQGQLVIPDELERELCWAQSRPGSLSHALPPVSLDNPNCFRSVLAKNESNFRDSYANKWPTSAWQLNQDPDTSFETHADEQVLMTIIRNCHLIYTQEVKPERWLTGAEALCGQGFPVHPQVASSIPLPLHARTSIEFEFLRL